MILVIDILSVLLGVSYVEAGEVVLNQLMVEADIPVCWDTADSGLYEVSADWMKKAIQIMDVSQFNIPEQSGHHNCQEWRTQRNEGGRC